MYTAEPSNGMYGEIIKKTILQTKSRVPIVVEAVFFAVDRICHIENEVRPLLNAGKIVICDRYFYSSVAYQGTSDLSLEWIKEINRHAMRPDLAIYIDVRPETAIKRLKQRKTVMDTLQTQRKVREMYLELVRQDQLVKIDGEDTKDRVAGLIKNVVSKFLECY